MSIDRSASQSPDSSSKRKATGADQLPVMTDADSNKGGDTSEIDMEDSNSGGADPGGRCSSKNDIDIGGDTEGGALGGGAAKSRSKPAVKRRLPGSTG